jgi:protein arginine kinase
MRNVAGFRFPSTASQQELTEVMSSVLAAAPAELEPNKNLTNAERDYLVACRLVSPEFEWTLPARALLINAPRSLCVMVNEEDHVRAQGIFGGWNIIKTQPIVEHIVDAIGASVPFARHPVHGFLAASPMNSGSGRRTSVMLHLIGLAHSKRLPSVLSALASKQIVVRGLFGESSRAIGAFLQVSVLREDDAEFRGALDYLVEEERLARIGQLTGNLKERFQQARESAANSRTLSLADAVRLLGWLRWAASEHVSHAPLSVLRVDHVLASLEMRPTMGEDVAATQRAQLVRSLCQSA